MAGAKGIRIGALTPCAAPLTLNPDSVSVVDGSICLEFAPEDRAAFFRFSVE